MVEFPDILEIAKKSDWGVETHLDTMPVADRRAFEHWVWYRTIGESGDKGIRELGAGFHSTRALILCIRTLAARAASERKIAEAKPVDAKSPAAASTQGYRAVPTRAEAVLAAAELRKQGKHQEADVLLAAAV